MKFRFATLVAALALGASSLAAQQQQATASPIDDLIRRAQDAFNDLNYSRADSLARQVLAIGNRLTTAQRTRALLVIAAAYYPEEKAAQKPALATATLKQIFRTNLGLRMPQELTWPGLDSLAEDARRNTFGMELTAERQQVVVGAAGRARVSVRSNRPARFRFTVLPGNGGPAVALDSAGPATTGEFQFATMRGDAPTFATGDYDLIVTGIDAASQDTVTVRYNVKADAPAVQLVTVPTKIDSTKFLKERSPKYGAKAIVPALLVGGAAFAFSSSLRAEGEGVKSEVGADSKGMGVAAVLGVTAIVAGFLDRGRPLPANIAANKDYVAAFQKSIVDADAENRRRIAEHRTTLTFELEAR